MLRVCLLLLFVAAVAGCGGTGGHTTTTSSLTTTTPSGAAGAIESRLNHAGYAVLPLVLRPNLSPRPVHAFKVQVDYASPRSFTLTVLVFRSAAAAKLFAAKAQAECRKLAECRLQKRTYAKQQREEVVGPAIYGALTDSTGATLPLRDYVKIVAVASGARRAA